VAAEPADADVWQRDFGERLRAIRSQRALSQAQLAARADLDPSYVSSVECGHRNVSLATICTFAQALRVPVREFFVSASFR
jgi:transcriptional regulator with XRE-family HTH domain